MFRGLFLIFFIINIRTSSCAIVDLYKAGQEVWKLYTVIDNRELHIFRNDSENSSGITTMGEMELQVDKIHEQLNQLEEFMGPKKIRNAIKSWLLDALTIRDIDTIELFIQNIDQHYKKFIKCRNETVYNCVSDVRMKELFQTLEGDIGIIRKFATNEDKTLSNGKDLVAAITAFIILHSADICETSEVIPNILIQLFRMLIIAELKTSTMLAYENIYEYVKNKDKGIWIRINSLAREKFEKQFAIYVNMFSLHLTSIDGVYNRACDPPGGNWIRGESFYELEKTFQTIVFRYDQRNCQSGICNYVMKEKNHQCPPLFYPEPVFSSPEDTIADCVYLDHIKACALKSGPHRYQFVQSTLLGFLGKNSPCPKDNGEVIETRRTPLLNDGACACNFYSSNNKISLLMTESLIEYSHVIAGLRFIRINETLHIQTRQGRLAPNGYIHEDSLYWVAIPKNINPSLIVPINRENRIFFLDDLTLSARFVLTGIKFDRATRGNVSGFGLKISGTRFNYRTGKLILRRNFKQSRQGWSQDSGKSLSFKPVSSVFTTMLHTVTPSDTKYVSLERSTLIDDFGQSTLPLFDAVPITFEVPTALGGVGIFHKGVDGYAGLFSLRVYGIKYEKYFQDFKLGHMINDSVSFNCSLH